MGSSRTTRPFDVSFERAEQIDSLEALLAVYDRWSNTPTGRARILILDPGSSSLCYMVAEPLGGALGGSARK
jgi:hypothetical protein